MAAYGARQQPAMPVIDFLSRQVLKRAFW